MSEATREDLFLTTRWTLVRRARASDTTGAHAALAELCQTYWPPLYAYVRRSGRSPHDAEDLTQGFFVRLFRLDSLSQVSRERGKFRAFLLASLKHFLSDERDFSGAQKRNEKLTLSLDTAAAEDRYRAVPDNALTPDQVFERRWAMTLLETVMERLRREYEATGRGELFSALRFAIAGEKGANSAELAKQLGLSDEAIRVAIHRLRQRYRKALREELAHTVSSEAEVLDELRELQRILAR